MSAVKFGYEDFDLSGVRTYPLADRASKVRHGDFARPCERTSSVEGLIGSLPNILAAADFRAVIQAYQLLKQAGFC